MNSRQILKLFISSGLWRAIGSLFVLLVTLVIAKKLGAESSGLYFLGFAIITFIANLSRLGMDNAVLKLVSINYQINQSVVSSVVIGSIILSGGASLTISVIIYFSSEYISVMFFDTKELSAVINNMLPYMIISSWSIIIAMILQGMQKLIQAILITNIITNSLLLASLLLFDDVNTDSAVHLLFFSCLINFLIGLFLIRRIFNCKVDITSAFKELLRLSKPFLVIVLCNQCVLWLGQIFLGVYGTPSEVSNFAIAQRISMLVSFFLMAINLVVAPRYARFYNSNDFTSLSKLVVLTGRINVTIAIPIILMIFMFSDHFFSYFGNGYDKASVVLMILAVGQLFNAVSGSVGYLLSMTGYENILRNNSVISAVIMIFLCLFLVQFYGVNGAAIATALSVTINNLLNLFSVKKYLGINSLKLT